MFPNDSGSHLDKGCRDNRISVNRTKNIYELICPDDQPLQPGFPTGTMSAAKEVYMKYTIISFNSLIQTWSSIPIPRQLAEKIPTYRFPTRCDVSEMILGGLYLRGEQEEMLGKLGKGKMESMTWSKNGIRMQEFVDFEDDYDDVDGSVMRTIETHGLFDAHFTELQSI